LTVIFFPFLPLSIFEPQVIPSGGDGDYSARDTKKNIDDVKKRQE
jgi:hypothetical protein